MDPTDRNGGLLAWQWRLYARNHQSRANLLLHMVAVPMFISGALAAVRLAFFGAWIAVGVCLLVMVFSFLLQAVAHKRELEAPVPFRGPLDFLARVFAEQFITFPRFVLSGGWSRQLAGRPEV